MAANPDFKAKIRALPTPAWTVDDIFHIGNTLDTWGRVTVTFMRGSRVKKVLVETSLMDDAVMIANLK